MGDVAARGFGGRQTDHLDAPECAFIDIFGVLDGKALSVEAILRKDEPGA